MGDASSRPRSGKLLDLPAELRPHPVVITSPYYNGNGESTDWIRREHIMETSPERFAGEPVVRPETRTVASAPPGTVTAASDALFPADESSRIAASLSMSHGSSAGGTSARSGRVVAGEEDEVFRKAGASGFNLLRPSEQAVAIDAGSVFYADALARE